MNILQTIYSKQTTANNFLKRQNLEKTNILYQNTEIQWKKLKDMPKSTLATFQNGHSSSKKLVKVTD